MNKNYKFFAIVLVFFFFATTSSGQQAINPGADSVQRIMMKDSLQIGDSVITAIFLIRNNYLMRAQAIRADALLTATEQDKAAKSLGLETNQSLKRLLGAAVYNRYKEIIVNRMRSRIRANNGPLAGNLE
jgi:ATP-dependent protease Clp ATPase subunit